MAKRILVVDDDAALATVITDTLTLDGFAVEWARDGHEAVAKSRTFVPDLVLLDVNLPGPSGFDICQMLRQGGRTPVIILSVRGQKHDKVRGLNLGADDYVTKPFEPEELVARIHAVLRRFSRPVETLQIGGLFVDFAAQQARDASGDVHLTHREYTVLKLLAAHEGHVVYREELLREAWDTLSDFSTRSVDNVIARLRKKIEPDPHHPRFIRSVRGDGYSLKLERSRGGSQG